MNSIRRMNTTMQDWYCTFFENTGKIQSETDKNF
jgi:hypothetical protein